MDNGSNIAYRTDESKNTPLTTIPTVCHTNSNSVALDLNHNPPPIAPIRTISATTALRKPCACSHLHNGKTCLSFLLSSFGRSFYLAYGIKAGITLVLHIIKLLRSKNPSRVFDLNELVSAHGLPIDAVRMGLFMGGFTGLYNGIRCLLARWTGQDNKNTVMLAGALAGISIIFQPKDMHRTLALYAWARVAQCWYNKSKQSGRWHLWGSDWPHGDALLFSVCSAQVMYSYVMRPDTLPPAYWKFIVDTGPIPIPVLTATKMNNRGLPVDIGAVKAIYEKLAPKGSKPIEGILAKLATDAYGPKANPLIPPLLPCALLHPHNPSCSNQWMETFLNGAKRSLPIYLSLTFVPMFVLRFWLLVKHPVEQITKGLWSVTKSTSFLSSFVGVYMFLVCMHRRAFVQDHRSLYWLAGFVASWSILLEQKSRRSELALYVLPRALDSLIQTMQSRKMLADVPYGEIITFQLAMGALMYYRTYHDYAMSPLLKRVLNFFVPTFKSLPNDSHHNPHIRPRAPSIVHAATSTSSSSSTSVPAAITAATFVMNGIPPTEPMMSPVASPPLIDRADSDGLSATSVNSVIPLPSPGVSYSREQSFANLSHDSTNASGDLCAPVRIEEIGPALIDDATQTSPTPIATSLTSAPSASVAISAPPMLPSHSSSTDSASSIVTPTVSEDLAIPATRDRPTSFVEEKVDAIEEVIEKQQQEAMANQAGSNQPASNGHANKKKKNKKGSK